jgi:hypothetical protein
MSALERLALLCPHGTIGIGGRGGKDRITAQDVAAAVAMAGLETGPELLVLVRYADQHDLLPRLRTQWYLELIDAARAGGWHIDRGVPRVRWLSVLTLSEHMTPPLCGHCNGTGIHHNQRTCAQCEGSGRVQMRRSRDYADDLQVSVSDWESTWVHRHRAAMARLDVWESDAERALGRAMR